MLPSPQPSSLPPILYTPPWAEAASKSLGLWLQNSSDSVGDLEGGWRAVSFSLLAPTLGNEQVVDG